MLQTSSVEKYGPPVVVRAFGDGARGSTRQTEEDPTHQKLGLNRDTSSSWTRKHDRNPLNALSISDLVLAYLKPRRFEF
jgi:hypothetical protein